MIKKAKKEATFFHNSKTGPLRFGSQDENKTHYQGLLICKVMPDTEMMSPDIGLAHIHLHTLKPTHGHPRSPYNKHG